MAYRMTRRQMLTAGIAIAGGGAMSSLLTGSYQNQATGASSSLPWPAANAILARVAPPVFPNKNYPITSYGANGDGTTDNTAVFQQAITDCSQNGGGFVTVPAGTFLTGAIRLLSNVNLHLAEGATILFSADVRKYPPVLTRYQGIELINSSPMVYAYGQTNIAVTGKGTLDGSLTRLWNTGEVDWGSLQEMAESEVPVTQRVFGPGNPYSLRTTFLEPYSCTNVLIQGITIKNAHFWQIHPTLCSNVLIDSVTTESTAGNTDGCDPESCTNVVIKNCSFSAGDDCIAIKAGRGADGRRLHTPSKNIVIMHCKFQGPWGMVACGSEESGGIQHVFGYDLSTIGASVKYVLFLKANPQRGGFVQDINLDTVNASNVTGAVLFATLSYEGVSSGGFPPAFDAITLNHMSVRGAPAVLNVTGPPGDQLRSISLANSTFTDITYPTSIITDVNKVIYTHVIINGQSVH